MFEEVRLHFKNSLDNGLVLQQTDLKGFDVIINKQKDSWRSLYWQYFEDLDKITSAKTALKLKKKLFKKTNTDKGEVITDITKDTKLKVGDLVRVRIELRSDCAM